MANEEAPADPPFWVGAGHIGNLWNGVRHVMDPEHPEDKDWADSEPDPEAP